MWVLIEYLNLSKIRKKAILFFLTMLVIDPTSFWIFLLCTISCPPPMSVCQFLLWFINSSSQPGGYYSSSGINVAKEVYGLNEQKDRIELLPRRWWFSPPCNEFRIKLLWQPKARLVLPLFLLSALNLSQTIHSLLLTQGENKKEASAVHWPDLIVYRTE